MNNDEIARILSGAGMLPWNDEFGNVLVALDNKGAYISFDRDGTYYRAWMVYAGQSAGPFLVQPVELIQFVKIAREARAL